MPRCKRNIVKSGTYHIMVRGVNKQEIFYDDKDKKMFIRMLLYYKKRLDCKIYAYCLMNNHVHILFKDKEESISDFMRNITSKYAYEFNQKHKRVGHLFQDRFKSIYVYNDEYLLRLIRYIHRNPEKAGICKTEDYRWSSYKEYIFNNKIIEKDEILKKFGENKFTALKRFIKFVNDKNEEEMDSIYLKDKLTDEEAKKFSKRTAHVETGVNLSDLSASLDGIKSVKNDKFTVFTLGRACVQKQPQLFNRIAELVPDARFIWIGNGELESELTAPNIEVTGWKPRKEALAMAKGADAFILCSLGEAIAMSLIENMYIKKLILVSNTMGNKSVINDGINGYVCDKAEEYAEHIKAAMKEFPKELAERAYQDVLEIYNTEAMKKKYIAFYNNVIAGKYRR